MKSVMIKNVLIPMVMLVKLSMAENPALFAMHTIEKELVSVLDPVQEILVGVGSSQCTNLKKILGLMYKQIEGKNEPDLDKLQVVYYNQSFSKVYNISSAAEELQTELTFDSSEKVVIFVHGFTDAPTKNNFLQIAESFIKSEECNRVTLLALDCSALIGWLYARSTTYVRFIGYRLAEMMETLVQNGLQPSQLHLVGHSLGAHICGFAGKEFFNTTGEKVGRISGLDPAGPCFTYIDIVLRLKDTDADYVDVIHGDAGVFGIRSPVGHADYFPNTGSQQPGCLLSTCSHTRPVELFAESLLARDAFPAARCYSWQGFTMGECDDEVSYMGYASEPGTKGIFYLQTAASSPYGLGEKGAKYRNNIGLLRNVLGTLGNVLTGKK